MRSGTRARTLLRVSVLTADTLLLTLAAILSYLYRFGAEIPNKETGLVVIIQIIFYLSWVNTKALNDIARIKHLSGILVLTIALLMSFGGVFIGLFFLKISDMVSRLWIGQWVVLSWCLLFSGRILVTIFLEKARLKPLFAERCSILVSPDAPSLAIYEHLKTLSSNNSFVFDSRFKLFSEGDTQDKDFKPAGPNLENIIQHFLEDCPECLLVILSENQMKASMACLDSLRQFPTKIYLVPPKFYGHANNPDCGWEIFNGLPALCHSNHPLSSSNWIIKSLSDFILGCVFLIIATPLMLIISALIWKETKGKVFFTQDRVGLNGEIFRIYKFRTMRITPETKGKVKQATKDDPRVTLLGRILRRTSMDELPQLLNVLKGDMSLVGPRPHAVEHSQYYSAEIALYNIRHRVKPGITGWAQVNGARGETRCIEDMERRIEYDAYYIGNWSITLDLKILYLTATKGIFDSKAY